MDVIPSLMGGVGQGAPTPAVPGGGSPNVAPNIVGSGGGAGPTVINTTVEIDKRAVANAVTEVQRVTGR